MSRGESKRRRLETTGAGWQRACISYACRIGAVREDQCYTQLEDATRAYPNTKHALLLLSTYMFCPLFLSVELRSHLSQHPRVRHPPDQVGVLLRAEYLQVRGRVTLEPGVLLDVPHQAPDLSCEAQERSDLLQLKIVGNVDARQLLEAALHVPSGQPPDP